MKAQMVSAVATGEVKAPDALSSAEFSALPNWINGAHSVARGIFDGLKGSDIEVFRGNCWQFYSKNPAEILHASLLLGSLLKGRHNIETRISIGFGRVDSLKPKKISLSQGNAFAISGQGLDKMQKQRAFSITFDDELIALQPFGTAHAALLDAIAPRWTQRQALACGLAFTGGTHEDLATRFTPPITKQAFGKHLAAANWDLVDNALTAFSQGLLDVL